jgi:hypothetical protein
VSKWGDLRAVASSIVAGIRRARIGATGYDNTFIAYGLLDQDLIKHDQAEAGVESELSVIYGRLGHSLPAPQRAG